MFFWNSLAFSLIQQMLAIWSLVPLPFINLAQTSGSSHSLTVKAWLREFWALLCQCVRWVQLCSSLSILWHWLSLGLEWKVTVSSPVATAEFSNLHTECSTFTESSFRIWNSSTCTSSPPLALLVVMLPKAQLNSLYTLW